MTEFGEKLLPREQIINKADNQQLLQSPQYRLTTYKLFSVFQPNQELALSVFLRNLADWQSRFTATRNVPYVAPVS